MVARDSALVLCLGQPSADVVHDFVENIEPSWSRDGSAHKPFGNSNEGWRLSIIGHASASSGGELSTAGPTGAGPFWELEIEGGFRRESLDCRLAFHDLPPSLLADDLGTVEQIRDQLQTFGEAFSVPGAPVILLYVLDAYRYDPNSPQARSPGNAHSLFRLARRLHAAGYDVRLAFVITGFEQELANLYDGLRSARDVVRDRSVIHKALEHVIFEQYLDELAGYHERSRHGGAPVVFSLALPCGVHPSGWLNYDSHSDAPIFSTTKRDDDRPVSELIAPHYVADPLITALTGRITAFQIASDMIAQPTAGDLLSRFAGAISARLQQARN